MTKRQAVLIELLAVIFRFCPSDGKIFNYSITAAQTVTGNKNPFWKG
jgi:hypothetical protein